MDKQNLKERKPRRQSYKKGRWSNDEQDLFEDGLKHYGRDWKKIQQYIKSRNLLQVRSHAQKYFLRLQKLEINVCPLKQEEPERLENFNAQIQVQKKTIQTKPVKEKTTFFDNVALQSPLKLNSFSVQPCFSNSMFHTVESLQLNNSFNPFCWAPVPISYGLSYLNLNPLMGQVVHPYSLHVPTNQKNQYFKQDHSPFNSKQ